MMPADFRCISSLTKVTLSNSSSPEVAKGKLLFVDSPKFHLVSVCTCTAITNSNCDLGSYLASSLGFQWLEETYRYLLFVQGNLHHLCPKYPNCSDLSGMLQKYLLGKSAGKC